jgi:hypothetical protein
MGPKKNPIEQILDTAEDVFKDLTRLSTDEEDDEDDEED